MTASKNLPTRSDGTTETFPAAFRNGHIFVGWFTEETGGEKVENEEDDQRHVFTANTTLYTHWAVKPVFQSANIDAPAEFVRGQSYSISFIFTYNRSWDKGTSLPYDIMKMLQDNPQITLVFSYKYKNNDYTVTIPGKSVVTNPAIPWYGPVYLYTIYGNEKAANATSGTYTVKPGDNLWSIAKRLKTTVKHLQEVDQIKNADKIKAGMMLKY